MGVWYWTLQWDWRSTRDSLSLWKTRPNTCMLLYTTSMCLNSLSLSHTHTSKPSLGSTPVYSEMWEQSPCTLESVSVVVFHLSLRFFPFITRYSMHKEGNVGISENLTTMWIDFIWSVNFMYSCIHDPAFFFQTLHIECTVYTTEYKFPGILWWFEVVDTDVVSTHYCISSVLYICLWLSTPLLATGIFCFFLVCDESSTEWSWTDPGQHHSAQDHHQPSQIWAAEH